MNNVNNVMNLIKIKDQYEQAKLYYDLGFILDIFWNGIHSLEQYNWAVNLHQRLLKEHPEIPRLKLVFNGFMVMNYGGRVCMNNVQLIIEELRMDGIVLLLKQKLKEEIKQNMNIVF